MGDRARALRLAPESADGVGVLRHRAVHELERALASCAHVMRDVYLAHSALTEPLLDVVAIVDELADEVGGLGDRAEARTVARAEERAATERRAALRADAFGGGRSARARDRRRGRGVEWYARRGDGSAATDTRQRQNVDDVGLRRVRDRTA